MGSSSTVHHHRHRSGGTGEKWIAVLASIWIQISCGASYTFGIYSPLLKSTQGYDQATLNTVSVFKDIGANAGILSGLLFSAVVTSSGSGRWRWLRQPWVVHLAGAVQCFVGYFMMWAAVTGIVNRPAVGWMCLFMFLAAHAQTFFNTANVVTAVHNFRDYSGTIVGIMKGFLGLSGAVLIQVHNTAFQGNPSTFLLMLAFLPTLVSLSLMLLVKFDASQSKNEEKFLNGFSIVSLLTAAYIMILIILENTITFPFWLRILTFSVLLVLLSSPFQVARKAKIACSFNLDEEEPLMKSKSSSSSSSCSSSSDDLNIEVVEELNLCEAMATLNFWLLFIAMVCGMGSGMATINNISQIGQSLGYTAKARSTLVSLWSIWNFLGRFGGGYVSDVLLHKKGWGRPLLMAIAQAGMALGHVIIASGFRGNLYVGSIVVGVFYGSQWSLMPTITSEIFGLKHMGTIFNTIATASPVGSYVLSVRVVGYIYDMNAAKSGDVSCYGKYCFMLSFFILACVSVVGCLVALALFFRTRRFYTQLRLRWISHTTSTPP